MPSTVIRYIEYNADNRVLRITFQTGAVYAYYDVPASTHIGLMKAWSKGRYFNDHISGHFQFKRL